MTQQEFAARLAQALRPDTWYRQAGALRAIANALQPGGQPLFQSPPEQVLAAARRAGWIENHPLFEDDFNLAADRLPKTATKT